jgi:hypothetical protein
MGEQLATSEVREYLNLVKSALRRVESAYYKLTTTYEPSDIVRERVFCYELYHQIRSSMGPHHKLSLNGEIDKRRHIDFDRKDRKNPDFVFHIPGTHERNTIVVEVKGSLQASKGIVKDFDTIITFVSKYQYKAGIFILYNHTFDELASTLGQELGKLASHPSAASIYILSIKKPDGSCEEHLLSELSASRAD